jgi:hypothetical protein
MLTVGDRVLALTPSERDRYEAIAERFESTWLAPSDSPPQIDAFLPADEPLRTLVLTELVKCDLESRLQRRELVRVESYLSRFPELAHDESALLEVIRWEHRLLEGQVPVDEYERRFPQLAGELRRWLAPLAQPGTWVPPGYTFLRKLRRGGMARVFLVRHVALGREEVLKIIDASLVGDADAERRFRFEARIAALLDHPNIVEVYQSGESLDGPYFVMEYCTGGSLRDRLEKGPLEPHEAARLLAKIAGAVHHAHAAEGRGIIHRDIKPENVLFTAAGEPKVADFGLAKQLQGVDRLTRSGDVFGTADYMAPEQARGEGKRVGPAADVYALGAVLYECLTGRPPFLEASSLDTILRKLTDEPVPPGRLRSVSRDLETICLKCLAKDPRGRYPSALALADDLGRFLVGTPVLARRQWRVRLAWHWVKTNPIKVLIALVLLGAAGAYWKIRSDERARELRQANERSEQAERLAEIRQRQLDAERSKEHTARVAAARQQARRGDWINALPEFDHAILDDEPDGLSLRVERLVGYFALNRTAELSAELDALGHAELDDGTAARWKLIRAAWLLCDSARQDEGRSLAREVLKARRHLSEADQQFAEGLAAERAGQAVRAFGRAVEHDPLHYLAASSYAVALAAVGRRQDARRQASFLRGVFPYSPMPDLAEAIVALVEGDRDELTKKLAAMAERLPADRRPTVARMETFLLLILELQGISIKFSAGEGLGLLDTARATLLLNRARRAGGLPNPEPLALPVPVVGLYLTRLLEIASAYLEVGPAVESGSAGPDTLRRLQLLNEDSPDAGLLLLTAAVRLRLAVGPLNGGDLEAARTHVRAAAELCAAALQAPSLTPHSAVPYLARGLGVVSDVAMLKLVRDPAPVHLRRIRESLHLLVAEGQKWDKLRRPLLGFVIQMTTVPLTPAQCGDWNLIDPAGWESFRKRMNDLAALGRSLLEDWEMDEPTNSPIRRLRESLEKWLTSSGVFQPEKDLP